MFLFKIDIKQLDEAIDMLAKYPETTDANIGEVFEKLMPDIARKSKELAPVDTGRLRAAVHWRIEKSPGNVRGIVEDPVKYAPYVHEGTRRMKSRPFIRNAIMNYGRLSAQRELEKNFLKTQRGFESYSNLTEWKNATKK